jgi:hypothetical protein
LFDFAGLSYIDRHPCFTVLLSIHCDSASWKRGQV